jgi:hypothetical protein
MAIVFGTIFVLIALVAAIRQYGFGRPLLDGETQRPTTAGWYLGFGGGGALFLVLGLLAHR